MKGRLEADRAVSERHEIAGRGSAVVRAVGPVLVGESGELEAALPVCDSENRGSCEEISQEQRISKSPTRNAGSSLLHSPTPTGRTTQTTTNRLHAFS